MQRQRETANLPNANFSITVSVNTQPEKLNSGTSRLRGTVINEWWGLGREKNREKEKGGGERRREGRKDKGEERRELLSSIFKSCCSSSFQELWA